MNKNKTKCIYRRVRAICTDFQSHLAGHREPLKIRELDEHNNDMQLGIENTRWLKKQLSDTNNEIENLRVYIEKNNVEAAPKKAHTERRQSL